MLDFETLAKEANRCALSSKDWGRSLDHLSFSKFRDAFKQAAKMQEKFSDCCEEAEKTANDCGESIKASTAYSMTKAIFKNLGLM